jgi:hypothetical protein
VLYLLNFKPIISLTIISIASAVLISFVIVFTRKIVILEHLKENHDMASAIYNAFGIIYAVLVAFVVFASWTTYDTTQKNIEIEANKIAALFLDAAAFDDPLKKNIRIAITNYTKAIVNEEWPLMSSGVHGAKQSIDAHNEIWDAYINIDIKTIKNPYMYEESLRQLNTMTEYRRLRRFASRSSTPIAIWIVLLVGGVISAVYSMFFGTRHIKTHCIMASAYTIINTMVLYLIYILDHPFTGYSAISNEPFQSILKMFMKRMGQ